MCNMQHTILKNLNKPLPSLIVLTLLLSLLFIVGLGDRPYSAPSESRYVEIGREMAESGDAVTPRLDDVKYFEKPPLFYWVQALATHYFGLDPLTARLPTAIFALMLCLLTYALGNLLYGRLAGVLGCLVLATSLYMFALSRIVLVDVPVSVFMVATLTAFAYRIKKPDQEHKIILYGMYAAAACAVLTKGLIGAILPGAVIFLWLCLSGNWKMLAKAGIGSGTALFLLIAVPWHILVSLRNPEFAHFYFIHEHFERYFTKVHGRYHDDWFFIEVLVAGLFPWIVFAGQAIASGLAGFWRERQSDGIKLFLLLWIVFILFFFSLSDSKLIPYILPVFPPIAVLIGAYLARQWQEKPVVGFKTGLVCMMLLLLALAVTPSLLGNFLDADSKIMTAIAQATEDVHNLGILSLMAAGALFIIWIQGQKKHVIMAMLLIAALLAHAGDRVAGHYNRDSMEKIAGAIQYLHKPDDEVVLYGEYYQDLPVYLKRRVALVGWEKTELSFGAAHEDTSAWMINEQEFWRRWLKNDHLMFAVMREDAYKIALGKKTPEELHLYPVTQDGRNILFMNRLPEQPKPVAEHAR